MFDITERSRAFRELKQVPVSVARIMLANGQKAIDWARTQGVAKKLPNATPRDNCYWKLQWHVGMLGKNLDPQSMYEHADDLKKWVMQAYVEANAVEEGSTYIEKLWFDMWAEIRAEIAKLPVAVVSQIGHALGIPPWALWTGGAMLVGLVGLIGYRKLIR